MKKSISVFLVLLIISAIVSFTACTPKNPVIIVRKDVVFTNARGDSLGAILFTPEAVNKLPALLQLYTKDVGPKQLEFARKIAQRKYTVMLLTLPERGEQNDGDSRLKPMDDILAALRFLQKQEKVAARLAIFACGETSAAAIDAAIADTSVAALVLLSSPLTYKGVDLAGKIGALSGRPVVVIAPKYDPVVSAEQSQQLYEAVQDPKKLVWLETDKHGMDVITTDMEPIVRRVILMLTDRYLKGK